jgi:hypothetical protein
MAPPNRTSDRSFILPRAVSRVVALTCLGVLALASPSRSAPVSGFSENWSGTSLDGWMGGSTLSNPGTGGVGGASDGFLMISNTFLGHLGSFSSGAEYAGDWSGIQLVNFWLRDTGVLQPSLEIHFGIGNTANFWITTVGFKPTSSWKLFSVDLSEANFTQIIFGGSFDDAIHTADRILVRHDVAPLSQTPNSIVGDFGLDGLSLSDGATPVSSRTWGRIKALYR